MPITGCITFLQRSGVGVMQRSTLLAKHVRADTETNRTMRQVRVPKVSGREANEHQASGTRFAPGRVLRPPNAAEIKRSPGNVVIIGAGRPGLPPLTNSPSTTAPRWCSKSDNIVGGIARTVNTRDIVRHRRPSVLHQVGRNNQLWRKILGEKFLERQRSSRILYRNHFFLYP